MKKFLILFLMMFVFIYPVSARNLPGETHKQEKLTPRERLIERSLERTQWAKTPQVVRTSIILGKYIAEKRFGWRKGQWTALKELWSHESGWQWWADNPTSSAYGIPQFTGPKGRTPGFCCNPVIQIRKGLFYIDGKYGSPISACQGDCSSGSY